MPAAPELAPARSSLSRHVFQKDLSSVFTKAADSGPSPEDLELVNTFARKPLSAEQVWIGEAKMANDQIDRDGERFHPTLLDTFARTLPSKKLLLDHQKSGIGYGRFFKAWTESEAGVKWLMAKFYVPVRERTKEILEAIEDGLADNMSIGFMAKLVDVKDGKRTIPEFQDAPEAEAMEGSLVWLAAQPGARLKETGTQPETKKASMKLRGKSFEVPELPEEFVTAIQTLEADLDSAETAMKELKADAAIGKAYHAEILGEVLKFGKLAKRIGDKPEDLGAKKTLFEKYPLADLKEQRDVYRSQIPPTDLLDAGEGGAAPKDGTKKDRPALVSAAAYSTL